ncbi:Pkinase-domain-containing protein [Coprinellus micaceus]|uniref:mitogen-activated protein kinase kinase kinase n=1 Tax=Coprinellus micaceus TaxID=71717 RepID=A0A4Y7TR25_COPMI|nr:Pkinase-domain-containing protein [Coprinellus micaceus]
MNFDGDYRSGRSPSSSPQQDQQSLLQPPQGVAFAEFLRTWSHAHVAQWLTEMKCAAHAETFRVHEVVGDLLLELDQPALREMSITSIGDRIRVLNGVRLLRQRCASRVPTPISPLRPAESHKRTPSESALELNGTGRLGQRKEHGRPPPLQLQPNANKGDLPDIIRESAPDSATIRDRPAAPPPVRPLPQPQQANGNLPTPGGRANLPPLPPPPRGQPPPPPPHANRPGSTPRSWASDAPAYTSQPLPPTPQSQNQLSTPTNWSSGSGIKVPPRSTSPLPPPRVRGPVASKNGLGVTSPNHNSPAKPAGTRLLHHPFANAQPTGLQPPANHGLNLSPIEEGFSSHQPSTTGTPSPPSQPYGRNPYPTPSLDDIKKKVVRFVIPDEATSITIDVTNCSRGQEVIEKVLKKIGKGGLRSTEPESNRDGYFNVEGWAVYHDLDEGMGEPLSETQLLAICNAPDHPARQNGLIVRRLRGSQRSDSPSSMASSSRYLNPGQTSKATKRASAISILSGLGVHNPEIALSDPPSPTTTASSNAVPWPTSGAKRPSKLRNFFGQRPPSELITDHLGEYFPGTEKKVLRTARHSMLLRHNTKRQSVASSIQPPSRFSTSTQGSGSYGRKSISPSRASFSSIPPPPLPEKYVENESIPRVSLSTDDGHSVDFPSDETHVGSSSRAPPLLPTIPSESFSDSVHDLTGGPLPSKATNRMSYLSELRSKRDMSDTASIMTVDEITAEVESRRVSKVPDMSNPDLDDWTKVENEEETLKDTDVDGSTLDQEDEGVDVDDELEDEEEEDEDFDIEIPSRTAANKWIKGALIGAGSFGKVYLGMDANSGLLMAVKQVELPQGTGPNQERKKSMLSALETEIELLKNLQHENIVQYLYSSIEDEHLNIFLEYVPGGSVSSLLSNYGAFEETLVRNFVRQILQGLNYLHERDIIHRDIKGANILVDNKGGVKISDFGISKKVDDNLLGGNRLHRPSLQGSVFWMAPEVVKQTGHTKKADIWSVGCLVVEMLTGEHPWAQLTQMQAIFKIGSSAKPAIPEDVSPEAQDFLQRTFELNHEDRPPANDLLQHPWIAVNKKTKKGGVKERHEARANASPAPEPV